MREDPERPNDTSDEEEDHKDDQTKSAPTRAGSNVPNAGRDPEEDRTE
jgi:hypothetical protein